LILVELDHRFHFIAEIFFCNAYFIFNIFKHHAYYSQNIFKHTNYNKPSFKYLYSFVIHISHFWDRPVPIISDVRFSYLALVQDKKIMCALPANACCTVYVNCPQALVSFKKYIPPPLPYFKVNICPLLLPHLRWPNYIVTLPRYFSFRLPHLNINIGPIEILPSGVGDFSVLHFCRC
jgi:hypothetical protein